MINEESHQRAHLSKKTIIPVNAAQDIFLKTSQVCSSIILKL